MRHGWWIGALLVATAGCGDIIGMDPKDPARGPGQLVGNGDPVSDGNFRGGGDTMPAPRDVRAPEDGAQIDCPGACRDYCDSLGLQNPVNIGVCPVLWGAGLTSQPVDHLEACRRLYADIVGRYPNGNEIHTVCAQPTWGDTVKALLATDEFVLVNQRNWADKLLYNNRAVNFERAYDMDELVGKTYRGLVAWDEFAAVTSAHPILVRRLDTAADRAELLFKLFLGRPPYQEERADLARLYTLWRNGYWEHPHVGVVPDAFIDFRCIDDNGNPDPRTIGECTSVLWGQHELTLTPDPERLTRDGEQEGQLWSGFLLPEEWKKLQLPGRLVASEPAFWEHAVSEVLTQYLGYDLSIDAPEVRHELIKYVLEYNGDIRALHYAVATSFPYLQSSRGQTPTAFRWTYGPLKQILVEGWIDSIKATTGFELSQCDHRLPHPEDYLDPDYDEEEGEPPLSGWVLALVRHSRWELDGTRDVEDDYRNLATTLGGCPSNEIGGRFTTVSVLNTAVQEAFVAQVCGIGDNRGASIERLLPSGMSASQVLDDASAEALLAHQQGVFLGRNPTPEEIEEVRGIAASCGGTCDVGSVARPMCFALLSSSEMLFY